MSHYVIIQLALLLCVSSCCSSQAPSICFQPTGCSALPAVCLLLSNQSLAIANCTYGQPVDVVVEPLPSLNCTGPRSFNRTMPCRYCFQAPREAYFCSTNTTCNTRSVTSLVYTANCTVNDTTLCFGNRTFQRKEKCNWTSGHSYWTALMLSIIVGGFGVDRFYLGYLGWGMFKLFSFGGLGVWTLIDAFLIASNYLAPADGSVYIA